MTVIDSTPVKSPPPVARSPHGQRQFSNRDLDWLAFVTRLRLTGMTVADMVHFAELVRQGEASYAERRRILLHTRGEVVARIAELQEQGPLRLHRGDRMHGVRSSVARAAAVSVGP